MVTINKQIVTSTDDCQERNDSTIYDIRSYVLSGFYGDEDNDGGFRWTNVAVPNGAIIISATLSLYLIQESGSLESVIKGIDEDNTPTWSSGNRPSQRAKTTAEVQADKTNWGNWGAFQWVTIDITSIISKITSRIGWTTGNALAIVLENVATNSDWIAVYSYDGGPTDAAKLDISYDIPPPTGYDIETSEESQHSILPSSELQHSIVMIRDEE